ncbi:MAG: hypothetical protein AB2990_04460 [Candidatus Symbiodolus clandestinus]
MNGQQAMAAQDAVSHYLASLGRPTQVAYFANSGFVMGRSLPGDYLDLVFRVEQQQLLVCDLQARQVPQGIRSAVSEFVDLVHQIERQVPEIQEVRGLLRRQGTPKQLQLRQKLAEVLEKQGATRQHIEGDNWLIYRCRQQHH